MFSSTWNILDLPRPGHQNSSVIQLTTNNPANNDQLEIDPVYQPKDPQPLTVHIDE
jgi:hypothetical protein